MLPTHEPDDVAAVLDAPQPEPAETATEAPPAEAENGDLIAELDALEAELDEQEADDLAEIFAAEQHEKEGRWIRWPALKGCEVHLAHFTAATDAKSQLEATYRKRKRKLPSEALPAQVEERLWEEAMFGTVVRGWRGMTDGATELPFTKLNYRRLMGLRRFRSFVLAKAREAQNFRDAERDEIAGN